MKSTIERETSHLGHSDQAALKILLENCKEILYVQIMGAHMVPENLEDVELYMNDPQTDLFVHPSPGQTRLLQGWRHKIGERKFALRIPKLQRAISSHVEKLTAFNVLLIQYIFVTPGFSILRS